MDTFPSSPPAAVRADLIALRTALDESGIPPKTLDRNVLIGTWNIRGLGRVLERWDSPAGEPAVGQLLSATAVDDQGGNA
jgi:hypothetical protein